MNERTADRYIPADVAARLLRTTPGAVRQLASRHAWRRVRRGKRAYYSLHDVLDTPRPQAGA